MNRQKLISGLAIIVALGLLAGGYYVGVPLLQERRMTRAPQSLLLDTTGEAEFSMGIVPAFKTADPCGSGFPEGAILYNDTANVWCGCE